MYARGMSMREIQGFLLEKYGIEVSPDFISTVTDAVIDEVRDYRILAPGLGPSDSVLCLRARHPENCI